METRFEKEIDLVLKKLADMGELAARSVEKALESLVEKNANIAREVIEEDKHIDQYMKDIESSCFRILLLDQPVASDFRKVGSALKMITDLERIGDYSVDIAEEVLSFPNEPYIKSLIDLPRMGACASSIVKKAVHSFITGNVDEARSLEKDDDRVDEYYKNIKQELITLMKGDEKNAEQAIIFMMIAKYLERIGDHAVNVGEWVDYSSTGTHLDS